MTSRVPPFASAQSCARDGGKKRNEASPNHGRRKPSSLSISSPRNVPFAWRRCKVHDGAVFYTRPTGIANRKKSEKCQCGIAGPCRARRPRVAGWRPRHGVPATFRAAIGARYSLPPLLGDFGADELVRKNARGGRFDWVWDGVHWGMPRARRGATSKSIT